MIKEQIETKIKDLQEKIGEIVGEKVGEILFTSPRFDDMVRKNAKD